MADRHLPAPACLRNEPAPEGFYWAWKPERVSGAYAWRVVDVPRQCRATSARGSERCTNESIAMLNRGWRDQDRWWHYCADHLYGRIVYDGQVWSLALTETRQGPGTEAPDPDHRDSSLAADASASTARAVRETNEETDR